MPAMRETRLYTWMGKILRRETQLHSSILAWESNGWEEACGYSPQGRKELYYPSSDFTLYMQMCGYVCSYLFILDPKTMKKN